MTTFYDVLALLAWTIVSFFQARIRKAQIQFIKSETILIYFILESTVYLAGTIESFVEIGPDI